MNEKDGKAARTLGNQKKAQQPTTIALVKEHCANRKANHDADECDQ
jgi:hypothetical protein